MEIAQMNLFFVGYGTGYGNRAGHRGEHALPVNGMYRATNHAFTCHWAVP